MTEGARARPRARERGRGRASEAEGARGSVCESEARATAACAQQDDFCPHTTLLGVPPLVRTRKRPRQEPMQSLAQPFSSPSSHVKAYGRALLSTRRASQLSSQLTIGRTTFLPVISTPQPARRPWISSSPASWGSWADSRIGVRAGMREAARTRHFYTQISIGTFRRAAGCATYTPHIGP